jgi:hypothetical protein
MNTAFASLPLPDARELERMPSEFAGLLQTVCSTTRAKSDTEFHRPGAHAWSWPEPVQVLHIDDPRASIYALFA